MSKEGPWKTDDGRGRKKIISAFPVLGEPAGTTVTFETQGSQEPVVSVPATAVTGHVPDQPYTQLEDESGDEIPDEIPETPTPAKEGTLRGVGQKAPKRTRDEESVDEQISPPSPQRNGGDTLKVLKAVSENLQKFAKEASTARLLAWQGARIEAMIGNNHWPTETINEMGLRDGLKYRDHKGLVEFGENAVDELEKSAAREEELRAAQERIRQLEAQIQAGPQPVSPAAGGVGYSPVSPAAGGAGNSAWQPPPSDKCKCTLVPPQPYVCRRIKRGNRAGMVGWACQNWRMGGFQGCGWPVVFNWPPHLDPK